MFESLKHWLESVHPESEVESLFEHPESEVIHVALASLLYHIISVDHVESSKEKHRFSTIMHSTFQLNSKQIESLYDYVKRLESDLQSDLETVNHYLKKTPSLRMELMTKLNRLMALDGINSKELEIFYQAMRVYFPEVKIDDSEF